MCTSSAPDPLKKKYELKNLVRIQKPYSLLQQPIHPFSTHTSRLFICIIVFAQEEVQIQGLHRVTERHLTNVSIIFDVRILTFSFCHSCAIFPHLPARAN
jgi:hypothetical protein